MTITKIKIIVVKNVRWVRAHLTNPLDPLKIRTYAYQIYRGHIGGTGSRPTPRLSWAISRDIL